MKKQIKIQITEETANNILDVLRDHQEGYSVDFASERILNIREFISMLSEKITNV